MARFKVTGILQKRLRQLIIKRHLETWQAYIDCLQVGEEDVPHFRHSFYNQTEWEPARGEELHHVCYRSGQGGDCEDNLIYISKRLHTALHANQDKLATEKEWRGRFLAYIHHPDVERWRVANKNELDAIAAGAVEEADTIKASKNRVDTSLAGMCHKKKTPGHKYKWPKRKLRTRKFSQRKKD